MPSIHVTKTDADRLARVLRIMARHARRSPPAWDGAGISIPVVSPGGGTLGRLLPGRGLYLSTDLKELGITRRIPLVYERSPIAFLTDWFRDASYDQAEGAWRAAQRRSRAKLPAFVRDPERGAITTWDGFVAARMIKGEDRTVNKTTITTVAAGWSTLFRAGGLPTAGAYTGTPGSAPSKDTTGSLAYGLTNPTGGDKKYLLSLGFTAQQTINMLMLYDLLSECGGLSVATTGNKTVSSTALTRYTDGKGVMVAGVVTTALGTGTGAMSLNSYTDQDNNSGQAGGSFGSAASTIIERTLPNSGTSNGTWIPLATGDYGVRAISTLNVSAAHSAGVIALEMVYPLMMLPGIVANAWLEYPPNLMAQAAGLVELVQTGGGVIGCLSAYVMTGAASTGTIVATLKTVAG